MKRTTTTPAGTMPADTTTGSTATGRRARTFSWYGGHGANPAMTRFADHHGRSGSMMH